MSMGYEADGVPPEDDKTYDKVAKILAKAERAGTPEEAETFFAKAQELITKHMLDEMVLKARVNGGDGKDEPIESEVVTFSNSFQKADSYMWSVVAEANSCMVLTRSSGWPKEKRGVVVIGRKSDREHVKLITTSLLIQAARLSMPKYAPPDLGGPGPARRAWRTSFRWGFAEAVGARLSKTMEDAARSHEQGDLLPVLASVQERVEQYAQENYNIVKSRSTKLDLRGTMAGRAAGERADVGHARVKGARGALGKGKS